MRVINDPLHSWALEFKFNFDAQAIIAMVDTKTDVVEFDDCIVRPQIKTAALFPYGNMER